MIPPYYTGSLFWYTVLIISMSVVVGLVLLLQSRAGSHAHSLPPGSRSLLSAHLPAIPHPLSHLPHVLFFPFVLSFVQYLMYIANTKNVVLLSCSS